MKKDIVLGCVVLPLLIVLYTALVVVVSFWLIGQLGTPSEKAALIVGELAGVFVGLTVVLAIFKRAKQAAK